MKSATLASAVDYFNKDRHLNDEGVALYVDALKLDKQNLLPAKVVEHVEDCQTCKATIFDLHEMLREQNYAELGPHPFFEPKTAQKTWPYGGLLRLAAVLMIGIVMTYSIYALLFRQTPEEQIAEIKSPLPDSTRLSDSLKIELPAPETVELYAANFTPSSNLEDLIDSELRAASLEMLAPKNGSEVQDEIVFKWRGEPLEGLQLKILNNREEALFNFPAPDGQLIFSEKLRPGLYYWKLETEEELLHVGKFYVGREK